MGKRNSFDRHLPAIAVSLSILVAVLVASLIFAINAKKPQQAQQQPPQRQKAAPAPAIGNRIKAVFDGIPASVSREHVAIIRKQLARTTPTGKWEEIEWKAHYLEPYQDTRLDIPGFDEADNPDNPIAAVATYELRQSQAESRGQRLPEPRSYQVEIPEGTQTTLRLRTENPLGGMSIFEVSVQQRGDDFWYKGLSPGPHRPLPKD